MGEQERQRDTQTDRQSGRERGRENGKRKEAEETRKIRVRREAERGER